MKYAEQLFMKAIEDTARTGPALELNAPSDPSGGQYAIVALEDGKIYVQADRKVLSGTDKEIWKNQIDTFFDEVLLRNGSLTVESVEGDELTITKDQTVWKGKDEHVLENGVRRPLRHNEYLVKLSALSHIDELSEASVVKKKKDGNRYIVPDEKNHPFAKDGFEYHTVYFQDFDGKYYRITLSVGLSDGVSTVYNVGQIKETVAPEGSIISAIGSKAQGATVSDTRLSQNDPRVKNYSMQNAPKNSSSGQYSFLPPDIYQEVGEREAYLAEEGSDTTPPMGDADGQSGTPAPTVTREAEQWEQLADIVQAQLGDEEWSNAISEVMERYAANGKDLDLPQAEREVVADWIGKNLYKNGFAQAIVSGDATVGNAFVQAIDRIRLAMGNKKSRSNTRLAVVERLFMRALENEVQTREGDGEYSITGDMTDQQRYDELKDRTITAVQDRSQETSGFSAEELEHRAKSKAEDVIYPLAEKIGILNRTMRTPELDISFELTKSNGLKASLSHQLKYGGNYADFARALLNIDSILQNAVLIEQHKDKYTGTVRESKNLVDTSVLVGVFQTENHIIPVQFEVKRLKWDPAKLYLTVALTKTEVSVMGTSADAKQHHTRNLLPTSTYSLSELFQNINTKDKEFLKYIPDGFLSEEQKASKRQALAEEKSRIESYPRKRNQYSFLPQDLMETGKPDIYQEVGEREAYLAEEGSDTTPPMGDADGESGTPAPTVTREAEQDGAIDENGELDEEALERMVEERRRTKAEQAALEANRALLEQFQSGEISESEYLNRVEDLRRDTEKETKKKIARGLLGSKAQKTLFKDVQTQVREDWQDRERQRRESKERTEKRNQLNREIDGLTSRLLNPTDGRSGKKTVGTYRPICHTLILR